MTLQLTPNQRARLGLLDTDVGEPEVLEIAVPPADQGRGVNLGLSGAVAGFVPLLSGNLAVLAGVAEALFDRKQPAAGFVSVSAKTARAANLSLSIHQQIPGLVLVESPSGRLYGRHAAAPGAVVHPEDDAGAILVDLNAGPAAIELPDGSRIVLQFHAGRIMLDRIARRADVQLPATILPPVHRLERDSRDLWARGLLKPALAALDPWLRLTAIGTFHRLWEPARAGAVQAAVARAIAGGSEPHEEVLQEWAGDLTAEEIEAIRRSCLARIDGLHHILEELDLAMSPDDPAWHSRFEQLCRERDDLESVRAVLAAADAVDAVDAALEGLDELGRSFVTTLPVVIEIDDERLRRAARADPDAWWAEPALA